MRRAVEECLELAKGDGGRDEYEVRSWVGWHRHVTLSLFALTVLAVIRSRDPAIGGTGASRLIPLTEPKVWKVVLRRVWDRILPAEQAPAWSAWRRRHRVRRYYYRGRGARPPD